jgi:hypothetical protein
MAQDSLSDYLFLTNHQIASEILLDYHLKAEAILQVLLDSNVQNHCQTVTYNHLWALNNIIEQVKNLNEKILASLSKEINLLRSTKSSSGNNGTSH